MYTFGYNVQFFCGKCITTYLLCIPTDLFSAATYLVCSDTTNLPMKMEPTDFFPKEGLSNESTGYCTGVTESWCND